MEKIAFGYNSRPKHFWHYRTTSTWRKQTTRDAARDDSDKPRKIKIQEASLHSFAFVPGPWTSQQRSLAFCDNDLPTCHKGGSSEPDVRKKMDRDKQIRLDCYPYSFSPLLLFSQSSYFDKGYSNYNAVARFFASVLGNDMLDNVVFDRKNMLYEDLFKHVTTNKSLVIMYVLKSYCYYLKCL